MALDQETHSGITPERIWGKLLELEGFLAGRGTDLLTPNQVYKLYAVTQYRLHQAVADGDVTPYDTNRLAEGGQKSYKVRRADVVRFFKLPPLPVDGDLLEPSARSMKRARRRA